MLMELNDSLSAVVAERDFYRRLLDLGAANDVEPLLDEPLALIVAVTGAQVAYLELYDDERGPPRFWKAHQVADAQIEAIQGAMSRRGRMADVPSLTACEEPSHQHATT
jgi:hypothetical protein